MQTLAAAELIEAWGDAFGQPPPRQALGLLAAAYPEWDAGRLIRLSVGQRDDLLLTLRERTFGPHITGVVACPQCAETVELAFDVADVRVSAVQPPEDGPPGPFLLAVEGYDLTCRVPDSTDLLALADAGDVVDVANAREVLFAACVLSVSTAGQPVETLPAETWAALYDAVDAALQAADPQADIELGLQCPACGHEWHAPFEIERYFWSELTTWAQRTLHEVHVLASAYGWSEAEILRLPAWRRQFYLDLVSG